MKEKRILVTGANGMLAANIIERLLSEGYKVTGTIRKGRTFPGMTDKNLSIVEADFKNSVAMSELMKDCSAVVHVAAMTSQSCRDYELYRKVNADATEELVKEACRNGLESFLYVSTANTIGYGEAEDRDMVYPFTGSFYAMSKKEAENRVLKYKDRIRVVIVNPTFMIGKYGSEKGSNRIFSMVRKSPFVFCPSGGKNVIDVREAARGMVLALEKGRNAEKYLICSGNYSYRNLFGTIAANYGVSRIFIPVPDFILKIAGKIGNMIYKAGFNTEATAVNMDILMVDNFYNTDKAEKELGFIPDKNIM